MRGALFGRLPSLIICPACAHDRLDFGKTAATCSRCDACYPIVDGVLDMLAGQDMKPPRFYRHPDYRRLISQLAVLHEAHYRQGSISDRLENAMRRSLLSLVERRTEISVDLGCGGGESLKYAGDPATVIGVDTEMNLLKQARKRCPDATLIRANLANLPFKSSSLKSVYAMAVLEHVFYIERTLERVQRCLTENGCFYVSVPTEGGLAVALARLYTSRRNSHLFGVSARHSARMQRMDHCNSFWLLENNFRKFFDIDAAAFWPFGVGGAHCNLSKTYRLRPLPRSH